MGNEVSWTLALAVKPGKLDEFKALAAEMTDHVRASEPGALVYEWFVSEDGATAHLYERYTDSDAVMTHMAGFGERFAERFLGCIDPTGFWVYGDASDAVREVLGGFGAQHFAQFAGFCREFAAG